MSDSGISPQHEAFIRESIRDGAFGEREYRQWCSEILSMLDDARVTSEHITRAARALYEHVDLNDTSWEGASEHMRDYYERSVRVVLEAAWGDWGGTQ